MTPEFLSQWIASLPTATAEAWHADWLTRQGSVPPWLLPLAAGLPPHSDEGAAQLLRCLPVLAQLAPAEDACGQPMPWAEQPQRQVQRVIQALLAGQGMPSADNPATLGLDASTADHSPLARAHLSQSMLLAADWLRQASAKGALPEPTLRQAPYGAWQSPAAVGPECILPVALVHGQPFAELGPEGVPAELRLRLVRAPGARLCLAPAPTSALLLRVGIEWDDTLARLQQQLRDWAQPVSGLSLDDLAIAWDLYRPDGGPLSVLAGGSAGASFALGALWLLRRAAPPGWAPKLAPLEPRHLRQVAVTATLRTGFGLGTVGGVEDKGQALRPLARALAQPRAGQVARTMTLYVSRYQPLPAVAPGDVPFDPVDTVWELADHLARQVEELSPEQQLLWQALVEPGDEPPAVALAQLRAVALQPADSLRKCLLRCWAHCGLALRGRLHQRFVPVDLVPLQVQEDALGGDQPLLTQGAVPFERLLQVLQVHDAATCPQAYLLRGPAGAGKSTLLRHHLQQAARRLLQHEYGTWEPRADESGEPPREVPVYLPLNKVPEHLPAEDFAAWLQKQWAEAGPPELAQLINGRGPWFEERGLRARVMLDGLNEVPVSRVSQRPERAGALVNAVREQLRNALPLLLSIRPRHDAALGAFTVLTVDLQDWQETHIRGYLERVFGPSAVQTRWDELAQVKGAIELCGRPMHLAAQCELLANGFATPPGDRAALYQAWLWLRLRRCLGHAPLEDEERAPDRAVWDETGPDIPDQRLLTAAERAAIRDDEAWRKGPARPLPMQGQLLRSLARQALQQWRAEAEAGMPAGERTAAPQAWATVAPWLAMEGSVDADEDLRHRFGRAARDLGLVSLDDGFSTWCFDHQSFGEYLASLQLLAGEPNLPPWLLQRLQPPALPYATDEDEIAAFDQAEAGAWNAVPYEVWDELARDGLTMPAARFLNSNFGLPLANAQALAELERIFREEIRPDDFADGTLSFTGEGEHRLFQANLRQWGDIYGVGESLGMGRQEWREPGKAGGAGWRFLITQRLSIALKTRCWEWLGERLNDELLQRLKTQAGRLGPPPTPDGAEVLGLALLGLPADRLAGWLRALCLADAAPGVAPLWPAMADVLPQLQPRLEPAGAWGEWAEASLPPEQRPRPNAVLQHLRRVLLLTALDAGAASASGVAASGMLALLDAPLAVPLASPLHAHWKRLRAQAFQGPGQRLRRRLQAGLLLGWLGDNLRYQFRCPTGPDGQHRPGLRPHPLLWASVGHPGRPTRFAIGGGPHFAEQPAWVARLPGFLACRLPLTVGEMRWFLRSPQGSPYNWPMELDEQFHNPAQPITVISARAYQAYAEWAQALLADDPRYCGAEVARLCVPTELQWEALARGPLPGWVSRWWGGVRSLWHFGRRHLRAPVQADSPTRYNHARSRWLLPSPVGVFSRGTTSGGLVDVQGNVWEFCASALTDDQLAQGWQPGQLREMAADRVSLNDDQKRAVRGGSFDNNARHCRPSNRYHGHPDTYLVVIGVRLVREWPPHSESRTP